MPFTEGEGFVSISPPGRARQDRRTARRFRLALGANDRLADKHCGADGWAMTTFGLRGVLDDAISI